MECNLLTHLHCQTPSTTAGQWAAQAGRDATTAHAQQARSALGMAALTAAEEHENKRRAKWTQYLVKHPLRANQTPRTDETFVRLVQGGIASIYREQIWLQASGAYLLWRTETGFYQNMVARPVDPESVLAREVEKVRPGHSGPPMSALV